MVLLWEFPLLVLCSVVGDDTDIVTSRVKRSANYQVGGVSARQDGEARILTWLQATGPLSVAKYNIYRSFTPGIPFDVTKMDPIVTISSSQPTEWKDDCRTEEVSVRYSVTAVDVTGVEHTQNAVPSNILPLVGSFEPSTAIVDAVAGSGRCSVLRHDMVFNLDLSEFLLVYDCDNDGDGNEDDIFVVRLDYSGKIIQAAKSIKASVPGIIVTPFLTTV